MSFVVFGMNEVKGEDSFYCFRTCYSLPFSESIKAGKILRNSL